MKLKDIIVIVSIVVIALGGLLFVELTKKPGTQVVVSVDGVEVEFYPLSVNGQYELKGVNGGTNILCIEDGKAYLISATCPDHLCVKQGAISFDGETITCLPNRISIVVTGGEAPDVDLVS